MQFTDEDFHIDLNQELYEECLERTRGVEERDMTDVDEEEREKEQDPRVRGGEKSPVRRAIGKLRRTKGNNIFSF